MRSLWEVRRGILSYPLDRLNQEVAYIAYHFHWALDDILEMEHEATNLGGRDIDHQQGDQSKPWRIALFVWFVDAWGHQGERIRIRLMSEGRSI